MVFSMDFIKYLKVLGIGPCKDVRINYCGYYTNEMIRAPYCGNNKSTKLHE